MREAKTLTAIFIVALALRLMVAVSLHVELTSADEASGGGGLRVGGVLVRWTAGEPRGPDALTYDRLAWSLAHERGFHTSALFGEEFLAFRPVLFPLVLAGVYKAIGHSIFAGEVMQCFLGAALCLLVYGLTQEMFGRKAALIAAMITTIYPSFIYYSVALSTETLCTVCLVGAVWLILRAGPEFREPLKWAPAGIVLGLAILTRSELIAFLPVLLIWALVSFPRKRHAAYGWLTCVALALFTLMPWLMRNYLMLGSPVLTTDGGYTFWCGNHPLSDGGGHCFLPENPPQFTRLDEVAMDREFYRAGFQFVERDPARFVRLVFVRLWRLWRPFPHADEVGLATAVVGGLEFVPILALAVWGACLHRRLWRQWLLFVLLFGTVSFVHMLFMSVTRYRVPLMPLLIVLAAAALAHLAGERAKKNLR